jgi:hypothetical protein
MVIGRALRGSSETWMVAPTGTDELEAEFGR